MPATLPLVPAVLASILAWSAPADDVYTVTLDVAARSEPATGRVVLFFIDDGERRLGRRPPASGPHWDPPQPIASVAVTDLEPGGTVTIEGSVVGSTGPLSALGGAMRVQAVLDADRTQRSHLAGPGNVLSDVVTVELRPDRVDRVALRLTRRVPPRRTRADEPGLVEWIELRSPLLSAFYGYDVFHRAGVALPPAMRDPENERTRWPAVYRIPGFGGREESALHYARMMDSPNVDEIAPIAVYVVLDPESPLGHHGFVDSPNHGPRSTALVTELIPYLEQRYPLVAAPEARLLSGHSSGGWSALWLQLRWPDVFGGCWASAPDPIDFRAFQRSDLYRDESVYVDAAGAEQSSYRVFARDLEGMETMMTARQEGRMEHAMHPDGGSGQQWATWDAMFSPRDPGTGWPRRMFDGLTGRIDRETVGHWSRRDISRLVAADWARYGPVVMTRVRLSCGELDSFHLDGAVRLFKERVETLAAEHGGWTGPGYVRLVPDATHGNLIPKIFQRLNTEMRDHLRSHGLQD
jgi:hypothetical protein